MKTTRCSLVLGLAAMSGLTPASAQSPAPTAMVQPRQALFREIGTAFKNINDELKKDSFGKYMMSSSARQIAGNLRQAQAMFPAGSGPAPGIKTRARPEIWSDRAKFDQAAGAATFEADKLVAVMRGNDPEVIRSQARALGEACKDCHSQFRTQE